MKTIVRLFFFLFASAVADAQVPQFKSYSVDEVFVGKNVPVIITKDDRMFRTRLREAAVEKPNFAGHYVLATWGCGAQCVMGAAINVKTGRVYWLPGTICCWGFETDDKFNPVEFRLNSKLIILSGLRNEADNDEGSHFYVFENNRFVFLKTIK